MNFDKLVKVETCCPRSAADKVRLAVWDVGGGKIGNYSHCAFVSDWTGYFMPLDGSNPTIWEHNRIAEVDEVKIEFICEKDSVREIIEVIRDVHPYEEPRIGVLSLLDY